METPAPTDFHPELDTSDFVDGDTVSLYQSYIGILRWAVELGRIDLAYFTSVMAKFSLSPREGHMTAVICGFAYVKRHIKSKIVIDPFLRDWSNIDWVLRDWSNFYPDVHGELLPSNMPLPLGESVQINLFCDAAHATDLVTRRSTSSIHYALPRK
jgi:hypothetical protein